MPDKTLPFHFPVIALAMSKTGSGDDEAYGDFITKTFRFGNPPKETYGVALFQNENAARLFLSNNRIPGPCHILKITAIATFKEFLEGQLTNGTERAFIDPLEKFNGDGLSIQEILNSLGA